MMPDAAKGLDKHNTQVWELTRTKPEGWIGTGIRDLFINHSDLENALTFYLTYYPETEVIQLVLDNTFHHISVFKEMRNMIVKHFLDRIQKEKEGGINATHKD
jgi:hypothetical protein